MISIRPSQYCNKRNHRCVFCFVSQYTVEFLPEQSLDKQLPHKHTLLLDDLVLCKDWMSSFSQATTYQLNLLLPVWVQYEKPLHLLHLKSVNSALSQRLNVHPAAVRCLLISQKNPKQQTCWAEHNKIRRRQHSLVFSRSYCESLFLLNIQRINL